MKLTSYQVQKELALASNLDAGSETDSQILFLASCCLAAWQCGKSSCFNTCSRSWSCFLNLITEAWLSSVHFCWWHNCPATRSTSFLCLYKGLAGDNTAELQTQFFSLQVNPSSDSEYISFVAHLFIICYNKCSKACHAKYPLKISTNQKLLTLLCVKNLDSLAILVLWHFIIFPISESSSVFHKTYLSASVKRRQSYAYLSLLRRHSVLIWKT